MIVKCDIEKSAFKVSTNPTTPLLQCPQSKTAVYRDPGFTSIHILDGYIMPDNRFSSMHYSHIDFKNQMSHADVIVAPSTEGQIK